MKFISTSWAEILESHPSKRPVSNSFLRISPTWLYNKDIQLPHSTNKKINSIGALHHNSKQLLPDCQWVWGSAIITLTSINHLINVIVHHGFEERLIHVPKLTNNMKLGMNRSTESKGLNALIGNGNTCFMMCKMFFQFKIKTKD